MNVCNIVLVAVVATVLALGVDGQYIRNYYCPSSDGGECDGWQCDGVQGSIAYIGKCYPFADIMHSVVYSSCNSSVITAIIFNTTRSCVGPSFVSYTVPWVCYLGGGGAYYFCNACGGGETISSKTGSNRSVGGL